MKYSTSILFVLLLLFTSSGCNSVTSAQALTIGEPLVSGGLALILRNNPSYIPIAQKVGADLTAANWSDLTLTGINTAVNAAVSKEGGDSTLAAIITTSVDAGLAGYLEAVGEAALAKDPNAVLILQGLGTGISQGAALAAANPKV